MVPIDKIPGPGYVEAILSTITRYPFAVQSLILLAALGAFCFYLHKRKQ